MERRRGASLVQLRIIALSVMIICGICIIALRYSPLINYENVEKTEISNYSYNICQYLSDKIYYESLSEEEKKDNEFLNQNSKPILDEVKYYVKQGDKEYANFDVKEVDKYKGNNYKLINLEEASTKKSGLFLQYTEVVSFSNYDSGYIIVDTNADGFWKYTQEANANYQKINKYYENLRNMAILATGIFLLATLLILIFKLTPSNSISMMFFVKFTGIPLNLLLIASAVAVGIIASVNVFQYSFVSMDELEINAILVFEIILGYLILFFLTVIKEKIYYMLKGRSYVQEEWSRILIVRILKAMNRFAKSRGKLTAFLFILGEVVMIILILTILLNYYDDVVVTLFLIGALTLGTAVFMRFNKGIKEEKIINILKLINNGEYIAPELFDEISEELAGEITEINGKLKNKDQFNISKVQIDSEALELKSLIKNSLDTFKSEIEASSINFKMNLPEDDVNLMGDKKKLKRVFKKIFYNNLKYSHDDTRVYVDLKEEDEKIKIEIKNIAKDEIEFSPNEIINKEFSVVRDVSRGIDEKEINEDNDNAFIQKEEIDADDNSSSIEIKENKQEKYITFKNAQEIIVSHHGEFNLEIDGDLFKVVIELGRKE